MGFCQGKFMDLITDYGLDALGNQVVVGCAQPFVVIGVPEHFSSVKEIPDLALLGVHIFGCRAPGGHLAADYVGFGSTGGEPGIVRGVKVAHEKVEAVGQQMIFQIQIKVEVPDEVQQDDVSGQTINGGRGLVALGGVEHICPHHHAQPLLCQIIVHGGDMLDIEAGGILSTAAGADAQLVDLVVAHMDKALGTSDFYNFVDDVEDDAVAFLKRRTVAVGVELVGPGVLAAGIFNGIDAFVPFGNFGVGVGDVLNMTEALHLGDNLKPEVPGVIEELPHLVLLQKLTVRNPVAVGEGGLSAFMGCTVAFQPAFGNFQVTVKAHTAGKLNKELVVAHGNEDIADQAAHKVHMIAGRQAKVKAAHGFIGGVGDAA